jgi:hypothetical protein
LGVFELNEHELGFLFLRRDFGIIIIIIILSVLSRFSYCLGLLEARDYMGETAEKLINTSY